MAPPRKNVPLVTTTAPAYSKGKGKVVEVAEPASHHSNLSDVHITDAKDFQSFPLRHKGSSRPRLNLDTPMSNSSKSFSACRSRWKSSEQRWVDSVRRLPSKKT